MRLNASAFISVILAFLVFMGQSGQPIEIVKDPIPPDFTYTFRQEGPILPDKVRIEIFDGLNCEDCDDFTKNILPKIRDLVQETSKIDLHLYFVPDINEASLYQSALALKCAADQGGFWDMHKKIYENKEELNTKILIGIADELELSGEALEDCIEAEVHKESVQDDIEYASLNNIMIKPTLLINEYKLIGLQPFENIKKIIGEYLEDESPPADKKEPITTDLKEELENLNLPTTNL